MSECTLCGKCQDERSVLVCTSKLALQLVKLLGWALWQLKLLWILALVVVLVIWLVP